MANFVPGVQLSREYYETVVAPIVESAIPDTPFAAGLVGDGSEVQGFDTPRSMDHDWGPRVQLFFETADFERVSATLADVLRQELPAAFHSHSTQFHRGDPHNPAGPWRLGGEIIRGVEIHEPAAWANACLGLDPRVGITTADWLSLPWTLLRGATGGEIWRDDTGGISAIRNSLEWYPGDIWRYVVACQWQRINQEEPFVGRTAEVGADLGSRIVAARQIREVMHLWFLLQRTYPPYSKWLETGFARLDGVDAVLPAMFAATSATDFPSREDALCQIYESVALLHNHCGMSASVDADLQQFHDRPFRVLNSFRFVEATLQTISDPAIRALSLHGCISQCVDSTDVLSCPQVARRFRDVLVPREA